ncbi:Endochitinase [Drechslerella dactyloides]|uniref:chitinase n=1 Tax=Drechslerella dactyloides TaxID=74499 RepID=A0AAD6IX20_DREDA|nr:Endochitinase [Drechslerella dactyloides]
MASIYFYALSLTLLLLSISSPVRCFDLERTDNVALYWGQSSQAGNQEPLGHYCARDSVDILIISFVAKLSGNEKAPVLHIAPMTDGDMNYATISDDIQYCRRQGKKILISVGGYGSGYELNSPAEATAAANQIWGIFLGGGQGGGFQRPFGNIELDGVDLDIESPVGQEGVYWPVFIDQLRSLYQSESGRGGKSDWLITASPQCPFPDVILSPALLEKRSWFDMLFIQFYNNPCAPSNKESFNFNEWAEWARSSSLNPHVKLFLGTPANVAAASSGGDMPLQDLLAVASETMEDCENARVFWKGTSTNSTYNPFGGMAFWDASWTTAEMTSTVKSGLSGSWSKIAASGGAGSQFFKRAAQPVRDGETNAKVSRSRGARHVKSRIAANSSRHGHTIRRQGHQRRLHAHLNRRVSI